MPWHTVASARNQWPDAPFDEDGGDTTLTELLSIAQAAVLAFAPVPTEEYVIVDDVIVPADPTVIPDSYRMAQLMQARNVWNSSRASAGGDFDAGSFGITSFPLDWQIRQLIRPKQAVPRLA